MEMFKFRFFAGAAMVWLMFSSGSWIRGADTNVIAETLSKQGTNAPASAEADLALRTYLKLQEQLHVTLQAMEAAREESSQEFRTNSDALAQRLELLEQSLAKQREEHWQNAQHSSRTMLILAGCVIGLGLISLVFTAVFQSRGMTRLAEIATTIAQDRPLSAASLPALGPGEHQHFLLGNGNATPTQRNLLVTVERLQERIQELERTTHPEAQELAVTDSDVRVSSGRNGVKPRPLAHAAALMGKAQVLLSLNKMEEALGCYDEALAEAPQQAETHLRRAQLLEKLKRYDEAVVSYDQALALNRGLTQAYLGKGAVFNHQERYSEALACYELALHMETNEGSRP